MLEFIPLLILAFLQGILEFLPVSSEGQILLVAVNVYGIDATSALSIIFWLHLGTAITVVLFYRRDIFGPVYSRISSPKMNKQSDSAEPEKLFGPLFLFVIIGTLGTAIVALPLYFLLRDLVTYLMGETVSAIVGSLLIITGIILYFQRGAKGELMLENISWIEAFILGIIQGVAVLPGISRSGLTLTWLLLRGIRRDEALKLSFILGVPAAFGVVGLDFILGNFFVTLPIVLIAMTLVALLTGIGSLYALRYTALKVPWWLFCLMLGSIVLIITIPTILLGAGMTPP